MDTPAPPRPKPIVFSAHALAQCEERGTNRAEVEQAVRHGTREPVRAGRCLYRYNLEFNALWQERRYAIKQVAPVVAEEPGQLVVVTVFTFFF